jgi:hypothetical protein
MSLIQAKNSTLQRKTLRTVAGLIPKNNTPGENLVQFVKVLDSIKVTPERIKFNSRYIKAPDGTVIEY